MAHVNVSKVITKINKKNVKVLLFIFLECDLNSQNKDCFA